MTPYGITHALFLYAENREPADMVSDIFPGRKPDYVAEKTRIAAAGFWKFYAVLDRDNRAKLVDAAIARYGVEATARAL